MHKWWTSRSITCEVDCHWAFLHLAWQVKGTGLVQHLVAQQVAGLHAGQSVEVQVQVAATDGRRRDLEDDIAGVCAPQASFVWLRATTGKCVLVAHIGQPTQ